MDAIQMLLQQHREVDDLFERIQGSSGDQKIQLLGQVCEKLTIHSQLERRHLYPFSRQAGIQDLIDDSLEEHAEVENLISELLQLKRSDPRVDQDVQKLKTSVQAHVKKEEEKLFPRLQSLVSQQDLDNLGTQMQSTVEELSRQELLKMAEGREPAPIP